ncbi:unnamed protein product [Lepeophtheirus salmonis]|uniref:Metalloendopeptidase n=1 Tax=Lepeophtheirus salmonis TaxID=72036 RepID=A0A7R8CEF0_LEPSM|nr:unnamed protein product [Lepeophtheirus salmonis]CAF2794773.1 unnamed protein product [Lepeophtheirus salmonis]
MLNVESSMIIPYTLAQGFSKTDLSLIQSAMDEIENKTCVRWVPRNGEKNYVYIKNNERGCFAVLGYNQYRRMHVLNLQRSNGFSSCMVSGIVQHEMLHILGYHHEQTRPDRDSYVKIHWDRIQRDSLNNYFKNIYDNAAVIPPKCQPLSNATTFDDCYSGFTIDTFGYAYDYGSVMHYGLADFQTSDNNTMDVLRFVPFGIEVGQRNGMTELDALKVKAKYKCDQLSTLSTTTPPTQVTTKGSKNNCEDKWPYYKIMTDNCPRSCKLCPEQGKTITPEKVTTKKPDTNCVDIIPDCQGLKRFCSLRYVLKDVTQLVTFVDSSLDPLVHFNNTF